MSNTKSPRKVYNAFFAKFSRKSGYIGSLLKNRLGNPVFEFRFDTKADTESAKLYLSEKKCKYIVNSIDPKKVLVML